MEHPDFQGDPSPSRSLILAFLVRTATSWRGFLAQGNLLPCHTIYEVVFVTRVEGSVDLFERIDVGRLFGPETTRRYEMAQNRAFRLI